MILKYFRFYEECLLREIIDPQYSKRLLKSDIVDPVHIKENMNKFTLSKNSKPKINKS